MKLVSQNSILQLELNYAYQFDYGDSDELASLDGSDDERKKVSYPEFNEKTDMKRPITLKIGMKFADFRVYKVALKQYCIEQGIYYNYIINEAARITVVCKRNCGWRIHASKTQDGTAFQIKTFTSPEHICGARLITPS